MSNLGQLLRQNDELEQTNPVEAARLRAKRKGEKAIRDFGVVEALFEGAKSFFIKQINDGLTTAEIKYLVGTASRGVSQHDAAYSALGLFNSPKTGDKDLGEVLASRKDDLAPLCQRFNAWAANEGLKAFWVYEHDGGGMHAWYHLRVKPLGTLSR